MLKNNLVLIVPRRVETAIPWSHVFVSREIVEHVAVSLKTIDYCFPLYIYEEGEETGGGSGGTRFHQIGMAFEPKKEYRSTATSKLLSFLDPGKLERVHTPNVNPVLLGSLASSYGRAIAPEDTLCYIYAVLYSNAYRKKYAEFLKTDFPRVPFTKDFKLFQSLAHKGAELVELHLLESNKLAKSIVKCEGSGNLRVLEASYDSKKLRVYVNPDKHFTGVPSDVWQYHIGGYQVAEKWLKDRKGRTLTSDEVAHYCKVITALAETIKIQETLDVLFKQVEKSLLNIKL
jgi:predicted helicase